MSSEFGVRGSGFGVRAGARSLASYADAGSPLSSGFGVRGSEFGVINFSMKEQGIQTLMIQ